MKVGRRSLGFLLLVAIVASVTAAQRPATGPAPPGPAARRLPQTVVPEHYALHFAPDFNTDTFAGDETIHVRLRTPSDHVTLHAAEIDFHEVTITSAGRSQSARQARDTKHQTVTLTVPTRLDAGPASIHITYTGYLNNQLRGFYLSRANNRKYAITQLEATDARRAFPSFDEPAFKATFDISVTIDSGDTAISNGRVISDTPGPGAGKHTLKFSTSAKMSSYLVAMAVGDFQCLSGGADGIPIRICATPDKTRLGQFALEATEFMMQFYNKYFATPYPFEKLDVVAVPDFAAGAMENTGAIFYRERLLTIDETNVSIDARRNVVAVLAHEMAHHWFGDLVTMKWWDDIWLNEGFATWMENKPVRSWKPSWGGELVDATDTQRALNLDALESTRAIRTKADTPEEINELFDAIAYEKSAAVLRMVEEYVGPEVFQSGVNSYLKRHAYANAAAEDFWNEIAAASDKPVDRIMASYVDQQGAPLVSVRAECAGNRTKVTLSQQRFFDRDVVSDTHAHWQVPICLKRPDANGSMQQQCQLFTQPVQTFTLPGCSDWVYANAGGKGVYRTAYEPDALRRLAAVSETALTPVERVSLLGDEWALVRQGRDTLADYLSLAQGLARDRSGAVVKTLMDRLNYISEYLVDGQHRSAYRSWVQRTLAPVAREVGWTVSDGEPDNQQERRASVLFTLGSAGDDPETLRMARDITTRYLDGTLKPDPALLSTAIQLASVHGDRGLYDRMLERARTSSEPFEKQRFLNALGQFTDPVLINRTIDLAFSNDVRSQDAPGLLGVLLSNPAARLLTWQAIKDRWHELERRLGVFQGIPAIVGSTRLFCNPAARQDVARFFDEHKISAAARSLRRSLENIDACIALKSRADAGLSQFLSLTRNEE
jgi:puromycin-sensitive aminopeptidase